MEQEPLRVAFTASTALVAVLDVGIVLQGEDPPKQDDPPLDLPYNNRIVDLAMRFYIKYMEGREWLMTNGKEDIVEDELALFFPGTLFAVMQQHPKWEQKSWFQGSLLGVPIEMHRVPEDMNVYWGYRGDDMIMAIGRITSLNPFF